MKTTSLPKQFFRLLFFLTVGNLTLFYTIFNGVIWKIFIGILAVVLYFVCSFAHTHTISGSKKLASLAHGCNLLRCCAYWFLLESLVIIVTAFCSDIPIAVQLVNVGVFLLLYGLQMLNSLLHIAFHAKQIKLPWHIAMFLWWWIPVVNLLLIRHIYRTARRELRVECEKAELDAARKETEVCKTRYPILMVHGIFFRDWQYFNYWGRIPAELIRNGAVIYYGHQQSSQSIQNSARELAEQIRIICETTGCEKVNIIAHSKGGLDCRCAMQDYGAASYIASLTTINTPHHGCAFVDELLKKVPIGLQKWIAGRYNRIFTKLGDTNPDFLSGVQDLTVEKTAIFNTAHALCPSVAYLTVMSKMQSMRAAPFPLWLGYLMNRKSGDNDGLVPVSSAMLEGVPFVMMPETKKRGISHGDVIDLMRENIPGYDVREWYVQLVKRLKESGF